MRADAPIDDDELEKIAMELGIHNNLHDEGPDIKTQCKFCEKSFRNKRYMMEHYVRHHRAANQKLPHRCEVCGKGKLHLQNLDCKCLLNRGCVGTGSRGSAEPVNF